MKHQSPAWNLDSNSTFFIYLFLATPRGMRDARPGTDPVASAVEVQSLSRWITRDVLNLNIRYTFGWLISVAVHQTPFSSFYQNYNVRAFCLALEVTDSLISKNLD